MKKQTTYLALGLGAAYVLGINGGLTAKKIQTKDSEGKQTSWYVIYKGEKEVFDCNPAFFKAWFRKEK